MIVYTQPACRPCKRVIQKLEEAGVEFDVIDISEDQSAWQYVIDILQAKSTPVIDSEFGVLRGAECLDKMKSLISWYEREGTK